MKKRSLLAKIYSYLEMQVKSNFILVTGLLFLLTGFSLSLLHLYPDHCRFSSFIKAFYANFSAEFISIAITILLIDYLYEKKDNTNRKNRLVRELGSVDIGFTARALKELKELGSLTDGSLIGADLSKADLSGLDFTGANLENVNLRGALLNSTILLNVNLRGANLDGAKLQEANLSHSNLVNVNMKKCNLYAALINEATINNVDFMRANLERCELINSIVDDSKFDQASFLLSDFSRTTMTNCKLIGVNVHSMSVRNTTFERCDLQDVKNIDQIAYSNDSTFVACINVPN
ncbi:pentapeptide repeat-containing protein [Nostoc sp. CHAB 5834]|nr:pentapeptide repeat-containing protein [Nostoc sp. CHAB 5834]